MFYFNIYIILSNIILNIFLYFKEIEVIKYFFKYFLNFLIFTKVFYFIVDLKDFILNTNKNIDSFLEGKEFKIYFFK